MGTKTSVPSLKVLIQCIITSVQHNLGKITSLPIKVLLHPRTIHCTITSSAKKKKKHKKKKTYKTYNAQ